LAVATQTKTHLVAGLTVTSTRRNGRSARRAEAAAPWWSDLTRPGFDFRERVGADLLVVHGPVAARCPADGPARRAVQGQGRGSWRSLAVQHEPAWMISQPGNVALVVVHELDEHVHDCGTGGRGREGRTTPGFPRKASGRCAPSRWHGPVISWDRLGNRGVTSRRCRTPSPRLCGLRIRLAGCPSAGTSPLALCRFGQAVGEVPARRPR